jgi:hypothetical protein
VLNKALFFSYSKPLVQISSLTLHAVSCFGDVWISGKYGVLVIILIRDLDIGVMITIGTVVVNSKSMISSPICMRNNNIFRRIAKRGGKYPVCLHKNIEIFIIIRI